MTLTLWLPPDMAGETETGAFVSRLNRTFVTARPGVRIQVIAKAPYGVAGLANMLMATQPIAPSRMPDVVAIDTSETYRLAEHELLVSLEGLVPESLWNDLFPFALEAATIGNSRISLPFQAEVSFLAYNSSLVETPPTTWEDLFAVKAGYVLPTGSGDGSSADVFLLHYYAHGRKLDNQTPQLDPTTMASILRTYRSSVESGALPEIVRDLRTLEDCWTVYLAGDAGIASTSSQLYGRDRAALTRTRYASVPTVDGQRIALARCWAWIILAEEPTRRQLAAEYITAALRADSAASLSAASPYLPTRRSVLKQAEDGDYAEFLGEQLEHAFPYPNIGDYSVVQESVARAIEDVLAGLTTPERAAVSAAATVARLR